MSQITASDVQKLTLAYFGRPADPNSLLAWPGTGLRVEEVVLLLTASDEYLQELKKLAPPSEGANTSSIDVNKKINLYYLRLFSRNAAQSELLDWSSALASNAVNFDYLGLTIANAGINLPVNGEAGMMRSVLLARLEAAQAYTEAIAIDSVKIAAYTTIEAADKGRDFLNGVTSPEKPSPQAVSTSANLLLSPAAKTPPPAPQVASGPPVFALTNGGAGTVWTLPLSNGNVVVTSV